jgi:hypothetical protein
MVHVDNRYEEKTENVKDDPGVMKHIPADGAIPAQGIGDGRDHGSENKGNKQQKKGKTVVLPMEQQVPDCGNHVEKKVGHYNIGNDFTHPVRVEIPVMGPEVVNDVGLQSGYDENYGYSGGYTIKDGHEYVCRPAAFYPGKIEDKKNTVREAQENGKDSKPPVVGGQGMIDTG